MTPRITPLTSESSVVVLARVSTGAAPMAGCPVLLTWTAAPSAWLCFARYGESEGSTGSNAEAVGRMLAYERRLALVTVATAALLQAASVVAVSETDLPTPSNHAAV